MPRVVMFGTYDADVHPRVAVLRDGLRDAGMDVVECNVPIGISTADRVRLLEQPWRAVGTAVRLVWVWLRLALAALRVRDADAVVVGYLGHVDVQLARLLFRRTPIVLDHLLFLTDTARDRALGGGWRDRVLGVVDRAAMRAADVLVLDTHEHLELVPTDLRDRAVVVAVGAPEHWFHRPTPPDGEPDGAAPTEPLEVVFFGLFTPLQGAPVIGDAIRLLADRDDVRFTMVGSGQQWQETRDRAGDDARCRWVPWVAPDELPALVAAHDVCLGIFGDGPKSLRVVPNKVYQGAAAGCAVVTSDSAPQRRALGDAGVLVPPEDADALAAALRALADDRARLHELRTAAHALAREQYRPVRVVRPLLDRLGLSRGAGR